MFGNSRALTYFVEIPKTVCVVPGYASETLRLVSAKFTLLRSFDALKSSLFGVIAENTDTLNATCKDKIE